MSTFSGSEPSRTLFLHDPEVGLRAIVALDDLTLGPGAGGIRTKAYPSVEAAVKEVRRLARSMTRKCALGGLEAGGAKGVVMWSSGLDRVAVFERLGDMVEDLRGLFRTAGDLGTTVEDLEVMATRTQYVETDERGLAEAVGRSVEVCLEAAIEVTGHPPLSRSRALVQGAGSMGSRVAERLASRGVDVSVMDLDAERAESLAKRLGARVVPPASEFEGLDILCPCADGGWLTPEAAGRLGVKIVCGAANGVLSSVESAEVLERRGICHVPDTLSSAGAVVMGIAKSVMKVEDPTSMVDALGQTTLGLLAEAQSAGVPPEVVARSWVQDRITRARARRRSEKFRETKF